MSSKIIELRQKDADKVNNNGDYECILNHYDISVKPNESIVLKNAVIDTEASNSQKITIKDPLELTIKCYKYWNYFTDSNFTKEDGSTAPPINAEPHFICTEKAGSSDFNFATSLRTSAKDTSKLGFGAGIVEVEYTDIFGKKKTIQVKCQFGSPPPNFLLNDLPHDFLFDKTKSLKYTIIKDDLGFMSNTNFEILSVPQSEDVLHPEETSITFELEAGNYSEEDLISSLNREVQKNITSNGTSLLNTPFFKYTTPADDYFVNYTGDYALKSSESIGVGASIFEFDFDQSTNQFSIKYIHEPYYYQGNQAVGYLPVGSNFVQINKAGGIVITELSSKNKNTGQITEFWTNSMGFKDDLLTGFTFITKSYNGNAFLVPKWSTLLDGINTTGGYLSIAMSVNISDSNNWYKKPTIPPTGFFTSSQDTIDILGSEKTAINDSNNNGVYLVSIEADNYTNEFYSKDNKYTNIKSIVSRYFSLNSYTTSNSSDSVIFQNKTGKEMILNKFKIKILNPNKELVDNLGENNSIYLEII